MPIRIQRKRTKGWRMPENTVYVGRPTKWGNPHNISIYNDREKCIRLYRETMSQMLKQDAIKELRGKNLACSCPEGQSCHADVLLEIANTPTP